MEAKIDKGLEDAASRAEELGGKLEELRGAVERASEAADRAAKEAAAALAAAGKGWDLGPLLFAWVQEA